MSIYEQLKGLTPNYIKVGIRGCRRFSRGLNPHQRSLPDFILIGAQRCGTTSLYSYLAGHPAILPSLQKEVHFFDVQYTRGVGWYRLNFPTYRQKQRIAEKCKTTCLTGEASPYYLFHPCAPQRIRDIAPNAKLIVLLRNPIERAYSHYSFEVRNKRERLSFKEAVAREHERLVGETEKIARCEDYHSFEHRHHSYLARGLYVDQISHWLDYLPRENFFFGQSEELFSKPEQVVNDVFGFLGLQPLRSQSYRKLNAIRRTVFDDDLNQWLKDYFRPYNERLYDFLGRNLHWDDD